VSAFLASGRLKVIQATSPRRSWRRSDMEDLPGFRGDYSGSFASIRSGENTAMDDGPNRARCGA
jgi:hypothetical protein